MEAPPKKPVPCNKELGAAKAQQLVQLCIQISPATHPPCNAQNECSLIIDEIKRACALGSSDPKCASYR